MVKGLKKILENPMGPEMLLPLVLSTGTVWLGLGWIR